MTNKDNQFLQMAKNISEMSTCLRAKCGAVIVKDDVIISSGYNTSPYNQITCEKLGYCFRNINNITSGTLLELCRSAGSHAESNAIVSAAKNGISTKGAIIYVYGNRYICNICRSTIINSGIIKIIHKTTDDIIFFDDYTNQESYLDTQNLIFKKFESLIKETDFDLIIKEIHDYLYGCSTIIKDTKEYIILSMLVKNKLDNAIKKMIEVIPNV